MTNEEQAAAAVLSDPKRLWSFAKLLLASALKRVGRSALLRDVVEGAVTDTIADLKANIDLRTFEAERADLEMTITLKEVATGRTECAPVRKPYLRDLEYRIAEQAAAMERNKVRSWNGTTPHFVWAFGNVRNRVGNFIRDENNRIRIRSEHATFLAESLHGDFPDKYDFGANLFEAEAHVLLGIPNALASPEKALLVFEILLLACQGFDDACIASRLDMSCEEVSAIRNTVRDLLRSAGRRS